jgi:hypothetical protein
MPRRGRVNTKICTTRGQALKSPNCSPDARLIVTLRNRVDRAYPHYWQNRGLELENSSFEQAIRLESERFEAAIEQRGSCTGTLIEAGTSTA